MFAGLLDHVAAAGAEIVADHDLSFAEAEGPAAARLRERAQLEERSLIPLLQRAHSLGITVAIENLAPVYPDDRRRSHDPPAVRDLVRRLDRPAAGMLFDLGHLPIAAHSAAARPRRPCRDARLSAHDGGTRAPYAKMAR